MKRNLNNAIKTFNEYPKGDRHVILIISALILLVIAGRIIFNLIPKKSESNFEEFEKIVSSLKNNSDQTVLNKNLFQFDPNTIGQKRLESLDLPEFVKRNIISYRQAGGIFKSELDVRKIYGMNDSIFGKIEPYILIAKIQKSNLPEIKKQEYKPLIVNFDPNKSTYDELIVYGFNSFQASNITEYKRKGGIFKSPTDLLKIYGIDSLFFKSIESYIQINSNENQTPVEIEKEVFLVELNSADSANLVKLEGIGIVLAKRILKYRDLLGGFYSKNQLTEVYGISPEVLNNIAPKVIVDTLKIQKLRLNFFEFKELIKHPYLNKKQVESVLKYREKKGSFTQISQVRSEGLLDEETYSRILPYLTCR